MPTYLERKIDPAAVRALERLWQAHYRLRTGKDRLTRKLYEVCREKALRGKRPVVSRDTKKGVVA